MGKIDYRRIRLFLGKEYLEIRQQRGLILGMLFLPVVFTLMPLGILFATRFLPASELSDLRPMMEAAGLSPEAQGLSELELAQALLGQPLSTIILLLPVILPSVIASYSIVGEKTNQTLEPVLATPITTLELLLAKILTAVIPAVAITWLFGIIFAIGASVAALSPGVFAAVVSPAWIILLLLCAPLLSAITVAVTVAMSSRANDPRTAQEISTVVVVPVILVVIGQFSGLLVLNPLFSLAATLALALLAALTIAFAHSRFQRETILTRWS